VYKPYQEEDQV
jgi:hypothetical protein